MDSFHVLAVVNNSATVNIEVHSSFSILFFFFLSFSILVYSGYMPRSVVAGLYDDFMPSFFFFL